MRVPIFIHQFDTAYANAAVDGDDRALPMAAAWVKAHDGTSWQATWDSHPLAVSGPDALRHLAREVYAPQGIGCVPWGVVHGRWEGADGALEVLAAAEGALAGAAASAAVDDGESAVYIVDLEPHGHGGVRPQFWRDDLGAGANEVRTFVDAFRAAGGDEIWLCPDARDPWLDAVSFASWSVHSAVTRVIPQVYVTDFVRPRVATAADARAALGAAVATLARHGWRNVRAVHPALPADAEPDVLLAAIDEAHRLDCGGVAIWQRANLRADTAAVLSAFADPWATTGDGTSGNGATGHSAAVRARLARARAEIDAASVLLGEPLREAR